MNNGFDKPKQEVRIIVRQGEEFYQPNGTWSKNKETAREFATSVLAYYWAKEQQLLGVDILMDFGDPQYDCVTFKVGAYTS